MDKTVPCVKEALLVLESKSNTFGDDANKLVSSVILTTRHRNKNGKNPQLNNFVSALAEAVEDSSEVGTFLNKSPDLRDLISNAIETVGTEDGIAITAGMLIAVARSPYASSLLTTKEHDLENYGKNGLFARCLIKLNQFGCTIVTDRCDSKGNSPIYILQRDLLPNNIPALRILNGNDSETTSTQYINCTHEGSIRCTNQVEMKTGGKHCKHHAPKKCQASHDVIEFRVNNPYSHYKPGEDGKCMNNANPYLRNMCLRCYDAENKMNESSSDESSSDDE